MASSEPISPDPLTVLKNDKVGRYCVASRDLSAGETLLEEEPVMVGPKASSPPLCLGCLTPLPDLDFRCYHCSWPLCGTGCVGSRRHSAECPVLSRVRFSGQAALPSVQYECVSPLRLLLATEADPAKATQLSEMEAHLEERRACPEEWNRERVNIVVYLRQECKLADRFSEEDIHRACGVLDVNSYEAVTAEGHSVRALYPRAAILSHCCVANTAHSILSYDNYRMVLRSSVPLLKGQELYSSYTGSLQPTLLRRAALASTKYFTCECARCRDPTELGSELGTLKCTKCDNGLIRSTDTLDDGAQWKCSHCGLEVTGQGVRRVLDAAQEEADTLERMEMGPERLQSAEQMLKKMKVVLHPNHAFNVSLWYQLVQLYGRVEGYSLPELPDILLERKSKLCSQLLAVVDKLEPGMSRIRGLTLYELHVGEVSLARSQFAAGQLTGAQLKSALERVAELLAQSVHILSMEPEGCPEAHLAIVAAKSLKQLRRSIASIS